jgi:hypothetical protein
MQQRWASGLMAGLMATALVGCTGAPPAPPATSVPSVAAEPSPELDASVNELMVAWIDNASHVLWDVEKQGFAPKNEADWVEVEDHAIQLAAAGALIQLPGKGPADANWAKQEGWKNSAKAMAVAGKAANAAAKARNMEALVQANSTLVAACEGCHKEFKPELPTEGVTHQRPHSDSHGGN